ncbi:MAG: succinylglutamate desuccinylase, partial [Longimicrobiales bacterium]
MTPQPFIVAGQRVQPGTRRQINLPAGRLPSGTELSLRLQILHGTEPGPAVWLSGAIHGDEIVGV